ncbi:MAG TPA: PEP-CTERM sorting domain-containing protein, partial [Vicinamibacterales bacterium]|nr:PEP-CTERM sorting domain-containing protein [Vicinamibacterales bacterium]
GAAYAGPVSYNFTFDTGGGCTGLSAGAAAAAIQTYMDCVLGGSYVSVSAGALAEKGTSYTGDGHVVGPGSTTATVTPLTLGNTEGATKDGSPVTAGSADAYIINNGPSYNSFSLQFQNGFTIAAGSTISFDYEIFPDGTCPSLSNCGTNQSNLPDFQFQINGTAVDMNGAASGTAATGVVPGTGGTYSNSNSMLNETAPQALGVFSTTVASSLVNPSLAFIDWPAEIGIDNLKITPPVQQQAAVPEPGTMLLVGSGVFAAYRRRRKRS